MTSTETMPDTSPDISTDLSVETAPANTPPKSFLVADCGSVNTTLALFDEAVGSYRLIARATVPTTAAEPWNNIHLGLQQAVRQIADITGRALMNERRDLIRPSRGSGTGVDAFAAVISAAPPLDAILVGLFDKVSLASARRAINSAYAQELDYFSLADTRSESEQINSIVESQPDLIFVTGGADGGAESHLLQLMETVQIGALALSDVKQPHILFAGNKALRERIRANFGENIHLHVAENVRPSIETENLDDAGDTINKLYEALKVKSLPGIQDVLEWSGYPLQPTAQALAGIVEYFAALQEGRVLAVDLGGGSVTLAEASPGEKSRLYVNNNLGMGRSIAHALDRTSLTDIIRWLPSPMSEADARNFIHNKALHPQTVPLTEAELRLEQAVARELLRCAAEDAQAVRNQTDAPLRLLLMRGSALTAAPRPSQALLILLDTLQPTGIFSAAMDLYGVLPALGVLATHEPLAAVQALEGGTLLNLGWVVVPSGKGQPGQTALRIVMESEESEPQRLEVEVEYGTIEALPLAPNQSAKVTIRPSRRFDIGFGPGKGKTMTIQGGAIGLVIDARGRPLNLPLDDDERQATLRQWLWDIGG
ncbi:MAG: hypothetical protein GY803_17105 [Chloroflexi bacterium]|nr:hypothetical protein [Chloroflexota bacterium]